MAVTPRQERLIHRIDALRDQALELERAAAAERRPEIRVIGTYPQMLREAGAADMEGKALRLRREAADLEWEL